MTSYYSAIAERMAGPGREQLVRKLAEYHHGNESLHMHEYIERREPCSYCWLRAGRAMQIVGEHLVAGPLADVLAERARQDAKWGEQNHPDGTKQIMYGCLARDWKYIVEAAAAKGKLTWRHVLLEEVYEALAEDDAAKLRAELVQVAATAVCWIEAIDRRTATEADRG
ncbi:hypothetical protein [Nonomuraea sp. bgisy101]|uniref:hypothetical protein n=1 Tax=Nonomuraea sp. bgisy101 TaxID=3413784 RepID=UPI003D7520B5